MRADLQPSVHVLGRKAGSGAKRPSSGTELYSLSEQAAIQTLDLRVGDIITITAGMPVGHVNYTNTLRVHQLTELSFAPFVQD